MKKIFFLLLVSAFIMSCSNDDNVVSTTDPVSAVETGEYAKLFEDYDSFETDGKSVSDKNEVIEILKKSHVTLYDSENGKVSFFSSDEKLATLTDFDVSKMRENTPSDEEFVKPLNPNYTAKANIFNLSGLNSVAGNTYYTNFSKNVFFITKYSSKTYFTKATNSTNINSFTYNSGGNNRSLSVTSSSVTDVGIWLSTYFKAVNSATATMKIYNDSSSSYKHVQIFENTSYGGKNVIYKIAKDQYKPVYKYQYSSFVSGYPKSAKVY